MAMPPMSMPPVDSTAMMNLMMWAHHNPQLFAQIQQLSYPPNLYLQYGRATDQNPGVQINEPDRGDSQSDSTQGGESDSLAHPKMCNQPNSDYQE